MEPNTAMNRVDGAQHSTTPNSVEEQGETTRDGVGQRGTGEGKERRLQNLQMS
jgi:hypothetical protein